MKLSNEQNGPQTGTTVNKPFDTRAAAAFLGLAEQTLRKFRVTGEGPPFVKLGRAVRYRADDLDAWVSARLRTCTSKPTEAAE